MTTVETQQEFYIENSNNEVSQQQTTEYTIEESHRTKLIKEVYTTEKSYNQHLLNAISFYLEPLRSGQPAVLENHMILSIFSNIEGIKELSDAIILDLERILYDEQSESIFQPFLSRSKQFQSFISYGKNQGNSIETIQKLQEKKPSFVSFLQTVRESQQSKLDLNSLLITPVQRMPRYKLLFNELLKNTEPDHRDFKDIEAVLELVTKTTQCVNEEIRKQENKAKVEQIQNCLVGGPRLINDQRLFVREGCLMKVCRKAIKPRWFFLFTDAVMYTSFNPNSLAENAGTGAFSPPTTAMHTTYTFHRLIMLSDINKIKDVKDRDNQKNAFQIVSSSQKSFTVFSETVKEKNNWLNDFRELLAGTKIETNSSATYEHTLGTEEVPVWVPDKEASKCMFCNDSFTIINRRHHCRNCGKVVCGSCSSGKKLIPNIKKNKPVRVCLFCFDYITINEKEQSNPLSSSTGNLSHSNSSNNLIGNDKYNTITRLNSLLGHDQQNKKSSRSNSNANLTAFLPSSPDGTTKEKDYSSSGTLKKKLFGGGSKEKRENSLPIQPTSDTHKDFNRTQSEPAFFLKPGQKGIPLPMTPTSIIHKNNNDQNNSSTSSSNGKETLKFQSPEFPKNKLPNMITSSSKPPLPSTPPPPTSNLPPLPPTPVPNTSNTSTPNLSTLSNSNSDISNNSNINVIRRTNRSNSQPMPPPPILKTTPTPSSNSNINLSTKPKPPIPISPQPSSSNINNNDSINGSPTTATFITPNKAPKPPQRSPSNSNIQQPQPQQQPLPQLPQNNSNIVSKRPLPPTTPPPPLINNVQKETNLNVNSSHSDSNTITDGQDQQQQANIAKRPLPIPIPKQPVVKRALPTPPQ
ncbi:pleckstrin (PH) domain-containing protein [Tieghemostelium lacteum]|uniref:Pleckstrin (PH) domain-containing protein n=1 Tax=Tieghemostelium lacteum TaxID=361077 RepID=A0A152A9Y5_TIELA|nr:pleckstrin (PH) domain-containing protein [Tieghemostelium lacteum]|eukprot:KYR02877.1 pleckstrin (PH) domain-containing protein [Tieghemostelium lacteum]